MERTIVAYHGNCPDGFGGAYAAWKKFGDTAEYLPLSYGKPVPEGLAGARRLMPAPDLNVLEPDHGQGLTCFLICPYTY